MCRKNNILVTLFACALSTVWLPLAALAHGVEWQYLSQGAKILVFTYADGSPMRYAEVKVFSPVDARAEHQQGHADKSGSFAFVPDVAGEWRIAAYDGRGHRGEAIVSIRQEAIVAALPQAAGSQAPAGTLPLSQPVRVGIGLSVLANFFGALYIIRSKKTVKAERL